MFVCRGKQHFNLFVFILNRNLFLTFQITFQPLEKMTDRRLRKITAINNIFV